MMELYCRWPRYWSRSKRGKRLVDMNWLTSASCRHDSDSAPGGRQSKLNFSSDSSAEYNSLPTSFRPCPHESTQLFRIANCASVGARGDW